MKIVHLSSFDNEGGAAKAAMGLHLGLINLGIDSSLVVGHKTTSVNSVLQLNLFAGFLGRAYRSLRARTDSFLLNFYLRKLNTPWSIGWLPNVVSRIAFDEAPFIAHFHWVGSGFLSLKDIPTIQTNFIWTLHDAWPFTGGCHVLGDCQKFKNGCGNCPQLGSNSAHDLSRIGIQRKSNIFNKCSPVFIAPSEWMAAQARSSLLLSHADIRVIPNGVDTECYQPMDKQLARNLLNLPATSKLILFGANNVTRDENKGLGKFKKILEKLATINEKDSITVLVFGRTNGILLDLAFPTIYFGHQAMPQDMAKLYSAADVVCVPSIQESFGLVALEAMSCGVPVVSFRTSGLVDIVEHGNTGFLAEPYCEDDFASLVNLLLTDSLLSQKMSTESRKRAIELFSQTRVASAYLHLYRELAERSVN